MSHVSGRAWVSRVIPRTPLGLLVWLLVLGMVAAVAYVGWLWRHPDVFPEAGGSEKGYRAATPGRAAWFGMVDPTDRATGTLTIRDVQARDVDDSADSEIEFFVCTIDAAAGIGGIGVVGPRGIEEYCSSLVPADGATIHLDSDTPEQIVASVTLGHGGRVSFAGMDVSYDHGWQSGTEHTGVDVVAHTRGRGERDGAG